LVLKSGYLGVLQERKTLRNVLHLVREGCISHIGKSYIWMLEDIREKVKNHVEERTS
jgi:hypothetical protein